MIECCWPIPSTLEIKMIKSQIREQTGLIKRTTNWRGHGKTILGTWNVRGLNGKEYEMVKEIRQTKVKYLALTETKKKGNGIEIMDENYLMIYSGVPKNERAKGGVAFLLHRDNEKNLKGWKFINERIMTVEIDEEGEQWTMVVVYAPNDNDTMENKAQFYEQLQRTIEDIDRDIILLGDMNARVGNRAEEWNGVIGKEGEETLNDSGVRLLEFCVMNDLVILNTMFIHKDIHKFTREEPSRKEKSIIDYIIVKREMRKYIRDTRVKRGPELNSDHKLVITEKVMIKKDRPQISKKKKKMEEEERIKVYKLREKENQIKFMEKVEESFAEQVEDLDKEQDIEMIWTKWKNTILLAATEVCGTFKPARAKKATHWWTPEIGTLVKEKKKAWKKYLDLGTLEVFEEYRKWRDVVKTAVQAAKKEMWKNFGEKMEENHRENQKLFYKVLKSMRKQKECPLKFIYDKEKNLLTEPKKIMERWKEYFQELLETKEHEETVIDEEQEHERQDDLQRKKERKEEEEITMEELQKAIKKMKLGKAAGQDKIAPEMIKYMGRRAEKILLRIFQKAWQEKRIVKDWEVAILIPIFKKGDNRECRNHRGITLVSVPGKVYSRILETRLRVEVENKLEETQSGFRPGRSVQDHIFTLRQVIEKTIEYDRDLYLCFIDLEKAFDRVPWQELWRVLKKREVSPELLKAIQSFYKVSRCYVRTGNNSSEEFRVTAGVRQGDILSPYLFIILMDDIFKEVKTKMRKFTVGYWKMKHVNICELVYADDIVLFARSQVNLERNIELLSSELEKRNMTISLGKTKTMMIGREKKDCSVKLMGKDLEQVDSFKYLGVTINHDGKIEEELNNRLLNTSKLYYSINRGFLRKKEISQKTKIAVYTSTYTPTLLYGSETWIITNKTRQKIQTAEMKFLRNVAGKTRRDKVRNHTIRKTLKVPPLESRLEQGQLRWFGHLNRMNNDRVPKQVWEARLGSIGKRPRGRPRKTWDDSMREALRKRGISWEEAKQLSLNRKEWRALCQSSTPEGTRGQD